MRFWVLTDTSNPSKILCSCEYIPKPAVVRTRCGDVQTREVKSPVIGSVFTPQSNRGKGYASLMINMLAQRLGSECEFDALYSDIGKVGVPVQLTLLTVKFLGPFPSLYVGIKLELLTLHGNRASTQVKVGNPTHPHIFRYPQRLTMPHNQKPHNQKPHPSEPLISQYYVK